MGHSTDEPSTSENKGEIDKDAGTDLPDPDPDSRTTSPKGNPKATSKHEESGEMEEVEVELRPKEAKKRKSKKPASKRGLVSSDFQCPL